MTPRDPDDGPKRQSARADQDGTVHVLLVEDSDSDALLLREQFVDAAEFRHVVTRAGDLDEAMVLVAAQSPDVVLLDLGLPGRRGIEAFRWFHQAAPGLPIVVLTALDDSEVGLAAVREGAQDFLIKQHIDTRMLTRAIRYAIERHKLSGELEVSRDRLRLLAGRLVSAREAERTGISRLIHDEIGHKLTAIKMDLHWLRSQVGRHGDHALDQHLSPRLSEAVALVDDAMTTMQNVAIQLRPSTLDTLGLGDALRDEARRFARRSGIRVVTTIPDQRMNLGDEIATGVFRASQELLTNVARHAQATEVKIALVETEGALSLQIADNGVGTEQEALHRPSALGILGIRERIEALGGWVQFCSVPGEGMEVDIEVPLSR